MSGLSRDRSDDAALVRNAQQGDASAFAELVMKYQDRLYNTCYRMCHRHEDALDLTQTALLKAWEALPRFESRANFYTWLFRIAVNQLISHRRVRRPTLSLRTVDTDGETDAPDVMDAREHPPSERLEQNELQARMEQALERIDHEFRIAVVLKDIEGLDYAEIGRILDVPPGTVKSRIHRGRMALRELLLREETERGRVGA